MNKWYYVWARHTLDLPKSERRLVTMPMTYHVDFLFDRGYTDISIVRSPSTLEVIYALEVVARGV